MGFGTLWVSIVNELNFFFGISHGDMDIFVKVIIDISEVCNDELSRFCLLLKEWACNFK